MSSAAHAVAPSPATAEPAFGVDSIESGLSIEAATQFLAASGLEWKDLYDVVLPARTLKHRRARRESLSCDESDKLARVIRIYDQSLALFGSSEKTLRFLRLPQSTLDNRSPLKLLRTEIGGRLVEDMLWQIADGVYV